MLRINRMFCFLLGLLAIGSVFSSCQNSSGDNRAGFTELRAPAYPLVTIDPYMSAWSHTDSLFNDQVRHWTGEIHGLVGAVRVDGEVYRFLGKEETYKVTLVPMAKEEAWEGKYLLNEPRKGWTQVDFDDRNWKLGKGAFGTPHMPSLSTSWETKDIWIRREFFLPDFDDKTVYLCYSHDDIFELYLNGHKLVETGYEWKNDVTLKIDSKLLDKDGKNVIAVHCHNRTGGGYVDFGLFTIDNSFHFFNRAAVQNYVKISATKTNYNFTCGPVNLDVQFVSPLLPNDLDLLARPVNYVNYSVSSNDGASHDVQIYFDATPQWAVNNEVQEIEVSSGNMDGLVYLKTGTTEQPVLEKKGDDLRIDWGYFYLAAEQNEHTSATIFNSVIGRKNFVDHGVVSDGIEAHKGKMTKSMPLLSISKDFGEISSTPSSGFIMLGYDDIKSIQYFGENLPPYWRKDNITMNEMLSTAKEEYHSVMDACSEFDKKLWKDAVDAGGKIYADLCVLAYRQSVAAHKLVKASDGTILFLSKENFSNGSIGTVDVTYPSAPLFLKYNPELLKGMLNPIFYYSESGKWNKPFAAHDVGTYPKANGQTYGGDMPVEECGNMIILTAAIAHQEGNAEYAGKHWDVLTTWAEYLLENGLDPENQLCTDDFAGHFAHNANLSIKAIMALACYGRLADMLNKDELAQHYTSQAKLMAKAWMKMADDGDHYRLTFDKPGTWSQKYNLVWDKLLNLTVFPDEVAQKEIKYYLTRQNAFGLPLDNRRDYTKADWIVWTATLADSQEDFQNLIVPLHRFITETPDRVPMSDWYMTTNAKKVGFQARSVVGGYFIKMLE
ncbi:glutaminase domain-containing protein [Thermophagus sp. OGC60D27]|uniref:glutaminase domain-containing protein n=1 Tax=Thermophagus sp. OGC60D27 TaxID=3458415 RepID=UPI00403802CC